MKEWVAYKLQNWKQLSINLDEMEGLTEHMYKNIRYDNRIWH